MQWILMKEKQRRWLQSGMAVVDLFPANQKGAGNLDPSAHSLSCIPGFPKFLLPINIILHSLFSLDSIGVASAVSLRQLVTLGHAQPGKLPWHVFGCEFWMINRTTRLTVGLGPVLSVLGRRVGVAWSWLVLWTLGLNSFEVIYTCWWCVVLAAMRVGSSLNRCEPSHNSSLVLPAIWQTRSKFQRVLATANYRRDRIAWSCSAPLTCYSNSRIAASYNSACTVSEFEFSASQLCGGWSDQSCGMNRWSSMPSSLWGDWMKPHREFRGQCWPVRVQK